MAVCFSSLALSPAPSGAAEVTDKFIANKDFIQPSDDLTLTMEGRTNAVYAATNKNVNINVKSLTIAPQWGSLNTSSPSYQAVRVVGGNQLAITTTDDIDFSLNVLPDADQTKDTTVTAISIEDSSTAKTNSNADFTSQNGDIRVNVKNGFYSTFGVSTYALNAKNAHNINFDAKNIDFSATGRNSVTTVNIVNDADQYEELAKTTFKAEEVLQFRAISSAEGANTRITAVNAANADLIFSGQSILFSAESSTDSPSGIAQGLVLSNSKGLFSTTGTDGLSQIAIKTKGLDSIGLSAENSQLEFNTDSFVLDATGSRNVKGIEVKGGNLSIDADSASFGLKKTSTDASAVALSATDGGEISILTSNNIVFDLEAQGGNLTALQAGQTGSSPGTINLDTAGSVYISLKKNDSEGTGQNTDGAIAIGANSSIRIEADENIVLNKTSIAQDKENGDYDISAFRAQGGAKLELISGGFVSVSPSTGLNGDDTAFRSQDNGSLIRVEASGANEQGYGVLAVAEGEMALGVLSQDGSTFLHAKSSSIGLSTKGGGAYGLNTAGFNHNAATKLYAGDSIELFAEADGTKGADSNGFAIGIFTASNGSFKAENHLTAGGLINVGAIGKNYYAYGIQTQGTNASALLDARDILVVAQVTDKPNLAYGIFAAEGSTVQLDVDNIASVQSSGTGIYAQGGSVVKMGTNTPNDTNVLSASIVDEEGFGTGIGLRADSQSSISLKAKSLNNISGAVWASGSSSTNQSTQIALDATVNSIYSHAVIQGAGDLNTEPAFADKTVYSALYAEGNDAEIILTGERNVILTLANPDNEDELERTVWAYEGADITLNGNTIISTDQYKKSPNSLDVAIAAGTAVGLDETIVNTPVPEDKISHVMLNYRDSEGSPSRITGDILAAYAGQIIIDHEDSDTASSIHITGNLLAGNGGKLDVDLGAGGTLTGRVDDYGDAGQVESGHGSGGEGSFFNPAFSSDIHSGGTVNLTMGEGARWNVTGQSWVTSITGTSGELSATTPVIDLISVNTDRNENAQALTVGKLTGNAVFNIRLNADRNLSDMLYLKQADGVYTINIVDTVTLEDMYAKDFDGLRFATVGKGSNLAFRAVTYDQGALNVEYEVGSDSYAGNQHNDDYNGSTLTEGKPGSDIVDNLFGENSAASVSDRMTATQDEGTTETDNSSTNPDKVAVDETTNFKLIGRKGEEISDAGKTIINMSRGNYAQAVYLDTLNKRQGEMRFSKGREDGLWARIRYDRIGVDSAYEINNTMIEIGTDWFRRTDSGEFHTGVALDYMKGNTDYEGVVGGGGNIDRYGAWLYTTWIGDEGDYWDVVGKFGHLENDFAITARTTGENIQGEYDNNVFSFSVEYGKKFQNEDKWYFEPQVQAQYAYVTSADYVTTQDTKVDLDAIHSLIGRVGMRLGKEFETENPSTLYIRGDVMHEFLGDQDIRAEDKTGVLHESYENEGTWYAVGAGFSYLASQDLYVFFEGEKIFGNSNSGSFTLSGGLRYLF